MGERSTRQAQTFDIPLSHNTVRPSFTTHAVIVKPILAYGSLIRGICSYLLCTRPRRNDSSECAYGLFPFSSSVSPKVAQNNMTVSD